MEQSSDFDLQNFLAYSLNRAAEEVSLGFQSIYKQRYGMLRTEWRVLFHLGIYGPMTAKEICVRSKAHKTKVSRAVSALEGRRFLKRKQMDHDKRHELLTLTISGQKTYRDLKLAAKKYDEEITAQFTQDELKALHCFLRRLAKL